MTTTQPAEQCGPACGEAHTYLLGECALSCTAIEGGVADPSWTVCCRATGCGAPAGEPCRRRDGEASSVSHGARWHEYDRRRPAAAATEATGDRRRLRPGAPAAPGTLRERTFAAVRALLGDGPWDVIAWHITDDCLAEVRRPVAVDQGEPAGGFRFADADGDRLYVTPTQRYGRPAVNVRAARADGYGTAAVDVPAGQVEDVIAGIREARRQASSNQDERTGGGRAEQTGGTADEQTGGVRVEYRASVPRHLLGAALAEGLAAVAAETQDGAGRSAIG
ncbi:hypothetical protein [[Kitasatospora] papulosa]|uniref:hypothetical protein n=1 Tax=[Kitasatospora] papulosa TaxID=1464011 RepID=UPI0036746BF6